MRQKSTRQKGDIDRRKRDLPDMITQEHIRQV